MTSINPITWLAVALVSIGGINWGLVGLFEFDLVAYIFGEEFGTTNTISRVVYVLVGASALVTLRGLATAQAKTPMVQRNPESRLSSN